MSRRLPPCRYSTHSHLKSTILNGKKSPVAMHFVVVWLDNLVTLAMSFAPSIDRDNYRSVTVSTPFFLILVDPHGIVNLNYI